MSDQALLRISNFIKVEEDLLKVASFREQLLKEKSSLDVKLNTTTQQQIQLIISNLEKLKTSAEKLSNIKENVDRINAIHDDSITNVKDYQTLKHSSEIFQRMVQTQNLYTDIATFRQYTEHIGNMIDQEFDNVSNDIGYELVNLYRIHYNVTQARNFVDYLKASSESLSDDTQSIVQKITAPLRQVVRKFDDLLKEAIISITEAVKEGNREMVVKLVRVIQYETTEDAKLLLSKSLGLFKPDQLTTTNYSNFRSTPRHYHKFFYDMLEESLNDTFKKCVEHFQEDPMQVYDNLSWLEDELIFVERSLTDLFPSSWLVEDFIHKTYFNLLHDFTIQCINSNPPAEDLMVILSYDAHYSSFISSLRGSKKSKKEERSILGEQLKESVLSDYMTVIVSKMQEWNENLIKQEAIDFTVRLAPDVYSYRQTFEDLDGNDNPVSGDVITDVYVLPDFKTTLSMLTQQADAAGDSGYGKVLVGVIENWSICYNKRVAAYMELVEEEMVKYMSIYNNESCLIKELKTKRFLRMQSKPQPEYDLENMTEEELAEISKPGLIEYLTALGNTYEINTDKLQESFLPKYKSKVHITYQEKIEQAFEDTVVPSMDLNAFVIRSVTEIIINDLLPALSGVFTSGWYDSDRAKDEPMAERIVDTVKEYMSELKGYASLDFYSLTFAVLIDTLTAQYLRIGYQNVLHGDGKRFDKKATKKHKMFSVALDRDISIFFNGLSPLLSGKDRAYLVKSLTALDLLITIASCNNYLEDIPGLWETEILGTFYDCSLDYVRGALMCCKDSDEKTISLLMDKLAQIKTDYHQSVSPPEQSQAVVTLNNFTFV
ncbi:hypothetical protein PUMCH_004697 [Australozyma saopauloensis]|uniref:Exocyst complex component Sec6 n=1 Tax=Australozyma saopauloensis TaxID=291208 RepID=A0AAX4HFX9_9ASCO|nr:hypothetical protein PUMCH_004697 [[Candida] saopauloensis]